MQCKDIEKHIELTEIDALSHDEKMEIEKHIKSCTKCKNVFEGTEKYRQLMLQVRSTNFKMPYANEITENIMNEISHETSKTNINSYSIVKASLRIAATIAILLTIGFYSNQTNYINNSIALMEKKYAVPQEKKEFIRDYNNCRSSSEDIIRDIITKDEVLLAILASEGNLKTQSRIQKYSSTICRQSTTEFIQAPHERKKKLLKQFIQTRL